LILIANIFVMIMPLAVLFIYVGEVGYPDSKMWKGGSWFPNQPHGIFFYILKWIGTICLLVGVFQITQLHVKIRDTWRKIRNPEAEDADGKTIMVGSTQQGDGKNCATVGG